MTAASVADGVIAFMNAALGFRFAEDFFAAFLGAGFFAGAFFAAFFAAGFFAPDFLADFFAGFFVPFLAVAIVLLPLSRRTDTTPSTLKQCRPVTGHAAPSAATIAQFQGKGIPHEWFFRGK